MHLAALLPLSLLFASVDASSISSTKSCYLRGENFALTFTDTFPESTDKVGIIKFNSTTLLSVTSICGTNATCTSNPPTSGSISIVQHVASGLEYKAVLMRRTGRVMATSSKFSVSNTCTKATIAPSRRPTFKPTRRPTPSPTPRPTKKPAALPTLRPTALPTTSAPTAFSINVAAEQVLQQARAVISGLVQANPRLTPEFMRMGFHDCVGGCDGCIDLANPDNNGLAHPISVLDPVVQQFANPTLGVTRADIWALAAMVGADVAPHGSLSQPVNFTMNWFGRVNCEDANTVCRNNAGQVVACTSTAGPGRIMASPNFDSQGVFGYFATNFGFDERQTVAIMGAHSVGHMVQSESGINGPNGWTFDHVTLQNEYYNALMGAASASTPLSQMAGLSPRWTKTFTNNSGTNMPDRNTWGLTIQGVPLVMLDSDIALVRDLKPTNQNSTTGAVSCAFNSATAGSSPLCPISSTIQFAAEFSDSNDVWMNEFAAVMDLMTTNGYNRNPCPHTVCALSPNPIALPAPVSPPTPAPVIPTTAPVKPTSAPITVTASPSASPSAPVKPTSAPTSVTLSPTARPTAPLKPTSAPFSVTSAPTESPSSAPLMPTSAPVKPTAAPVQPTSAPVEPTSAPSASPTTAPSKAPISPRTPAPVQPTPAPITPTSTPVQLTLAPSKQSIKSPTPAPVTSTEAPIQPTGSPTSPKANVPNPTGSPSTAPPA